MAEWQRGGAGDGFRECKQLGVFCPAERLGPEELLQADDLRSPGSGLTDARFGFREVFRRIERTAHLDQAYGEFV